MALADVASTWLATVANRRALRVARGTGKRASGARFEIWSEGRSSLEVFSAASFCKKNVPTAVKLLSLPDMERISIARDLPTAVRARRYLVAQA